MHSISTQGTKRSLEDPTTQPPTKKQRTEALLPKPRLPDQNISPIQQLCQTHSDFISSDEAKSKLGLEGPNDHSMASDLSDQLIDGKKSNKWDLGKDPDKLDRGADSDIRVLDAKNVTDVEGVLTEDPSLSTLKQMFDRLSDSEIPDFFNTVRKVLSRRPDLNSDELRKAMICRFPDKRWEQPQIDFDFGQWLLKEKLSEEDMLIFLSRKHIPLPILLQFSQKLVNECPQIKSPDLRKMVVRHFLDVIWKHSEHALNIALCKLLLKSNLSHEEKHELLALEQLPYEISSLIPIANNIETISRHWKNLAASVSSSREGIIIVLGGDHSLEPGVLRGLKQKNGQPPGVVWIDAHADISQPTTTVTGDVHAMAFWYGLKEKSIDPRAAVYVGGRSEAFEAKEISCNPLIDELELPNFSKEDIDKRGVDSIAQEITKRVGLNPHISFDIDALDPQFAPGTGTPEPNGLHPEKVKDLIRILKPDSFTLAEVDPLLDKDGITLKHAMEAIHAAVGDHKKINVICAPTNKGQPNQGTALAPSALLKLGLIQDLEKRDIAVSVNTVEV